MSTSDSLVIRVLTPDDVALLEAMSTMFGDAFDEIDTYTESRPRADYLRQLLDSDNFIALVALKGDAVVGGIAAYELPKFEQERREIFIYDLAVAAGHRRQGIATAMLEEIKTVAAVRKAYLVFVQAELGDTPASELYAKFGTCEKALHYDINIPCAD